MSNSNIYLFPHNRFPFPFVRIEEGLRSLNWSMEYYLNVECNMRMKIVHQASCGQELRECLWITQREIAHHRLKVYTKRCKKKKKKNMRVIWLEIARANMHILYAVWSAYANTSYITWICELWTGLLSHVIYAYSTFLRLRGVCTPRLLYMQFIRNILSLERRKIRSASRLTAEICRNGMFYFKPRRLYTDPNVYRAKRCITE